MAEQAPIFKHDRVEVHEIGKGVRIEGKDAAGRTRVILVVAEGPCVSISLIDPASGCATNIVWQEGM